MKTYIQLFVILIGMAGMAQTPPLEDHTWYLEKLILNGVDHYVPNSFENHYTAVFSNSTDYMLDSPCSPIGGTLTYGGNQTFFINQASTNFQVCPGLPGVDEYDVLIDDEFIGGSGTINNDFSYAFTNQTNNLIILTLTNANGDQAIYQNQPLSIADKGELSKILLYPNPVKDVLTIQSPGILLEKIEIFGVRGKRLKSLSRNLEQIDMQGFGNGVYFLKIFNDRGARVEKIMKY